MLAELVRARGFGLERKCVFIATNKNMTFQLSLGQCFRRIELLMQAFSKEGIIISTEMDVIDVRIETA